MPDPRFPIAGLPDAELERALRDLGAWVAYPATPDIATQIGTRLRAEPGRGNAPRPVDVSLSPGTPWGRRLVLAAACLLVAIVAALALFPEARLAIADRIGLRGVFIEWVEERPAPEPSPIGAAMMLGRPVTIPEAQAAVDFPVLLPTAAGFAHPGEVYLSGAGKGAMISFVYPATADLPASDESGAGALLTQFQGETERGLIEKGLVAPDNDQDGTRLDLVDVNGHRGYWITGTPHAVFFVCYDQGECRQELHRLAGDVLLWEQDGLTLRLESALPRDEAIAVAASVRASE